MEFIFVYFHPFSFGIRLLHCFSVCFYSFWWCCVGLLLSIVNWLSCIKLFIFSLYSSVVSMNMVFPEQYYIIAYI